jgi:hypothetical protein
MLYYNTIILAKMIVNKFCENALRKKRHEAREGRTQRSYPQIMEINGIMGYERSE